MKKLVLFLILFRLPLMGSAQDNNKHLSTLLFPKDSNGFAVRAIKTLSFEYGSRINYNMDFKVAEKFKGIDINRFLHYNVNLKLRNNYSITYTYHYIFDEFPLQVGYNDSSYKQALDKIFYHERGLYFNRNIKYRKATFGIGLGPKIRYNGSNIVVKYMSRSKNVIYFRKSLGAAVRGNVKFDILGPIYINLTADYIRYFDKDPPYLDTYGKPAVNKASNNILYLTGNLGLNF